MKSMNLLKFTARLAAIIIWIYALIQLVWRNICRLDTFNFANSDALIVYSVSKIILYTSLILAGVSLLQLRSAWKSSKIFHKMTYVLGAMIMLTIICAPFVQPVYYHWGGLYFSPTFGWQMLMALFGGLWLWKLPHYDICTH